MSESKNHPARTDAYFGEAEKDLCSGKLKQDSD